MSAIPLFCAASANAGLDLRALIGQVLDGGQFILGPKLAQFEAAFARYHEVAHCVGLGNGTDALELALRALGVGPGARVVMVANAGCYAASACRAAGAAPLYVDVAADSLNLCPQALARALALRPRPDAVIATHLYGQMAAMPEITALCAAAGVPLIEDCAQAHGATLAGRKAGAWGRLAAFSFYPTKNLGALGDGGALLTDDAALAERLRALRQYGWSDKYRVSIPGGRNSRLDELQAAVLLAKLPLLDAHNAWRRRVAAQYSAAFAGLPLVCPPAPGGDCAAHLYVLRCTQRDALARHLRAQAVACAVHYPVADHAQPGYPAAVCASLAVTEAACAQVLSLPCYPGLADADVARVIAAVRSFFALPAPVA